MLNWIKVATLRERDQDPTDTFIRLGSNTMTFNIKFQKAHPDVYAARFPPSETAPVNNVRKPRIKPALLSRPLLKLKSFRI